MPKGEKTTYASAVKNEPEITKTIIEVAGKTGVKIEGLNNRLKSEKSFIRKREKAPNAAINDILRYTYTASPDMYVDAIQKSIAEFEKAGYKTVRLRNYWVEAADPFNGVNTLIRAPNGQIFEVQYHTRESFELKNGELHKLYERQRTFDDESYEFWELQQEMFSLSKKLIIPENVSEMKSYGI
ncbi:MAG: hypothetical protein LBC28_02895 [Oscillospiraceae bacterium]|jgi:hypothetical protein|nr:hypothetical protein [Oscillospiraceae bacterium]